jgi:hypothetical protein
MRIDIAATAIYHGMTVSQFSDLDRSYTPPLGSPWGSSPDGRPGRGPGGHLQPSVGTALPLNSRRSSLPVAVLGSSSMISIIRGYL